MNRCTTRPLLALALGVLAALPPTAKGDSAHPNSRRPADDKELRSWLENMVWHHRFSDAEIRSATGLEVAEIEAARERFHIHPETKPTRAPEAPLLVLPYPGGRHPRIGFLDGAVDPQRETKVSVFTPWDPESYVVVDIPEAIWSNLGLTYLAHTHVDTIWTTRNIPLAPTEWKAHDDGSFTMERTLPNGIAFGTTVRPAPDAVHMEMWLKNGTDRPLTDLRVQNCVMLKGAKGFTAQSNDNKTLAEPYAAVHDEAKRRWVITAWTPHQRSWANEKCPCLHSDPRFPDCAPGETQRLRGWLSFHEGEDLESELKRIETTGWWSAQ